MIFLYLSSTLYHVLPESRAKRVFRVLDHVAIFLLIAGTYSPFTLGVLRGPWGWTLFSIVWSLAVLGVTLKITGALWHPRLSTGLCLAMGWLMVMAIRPLWLKVPLPAFSCCWPEASHTRPGWHSMGLSGNATAISCGISLSFWVPPVTIFASFGTGSVVRFRAEFSSPSLEELDHACTL